MYIAFVLKSTYLVICNKHSFDFFCPKFCHKWVPRQMIIGTNNYKTQCSHLFSTNLTHILKQRFLSSLIYRPECFKINVLNKNKYW